MKYLKILSVVIFISIISLSFRTGSLIIDHPIIEDAYYTFSIAKNIANNNGITADGENLTNGFQPLYTFLIIPAFAVTNNDYLSIRIIFILLLLIFISSAYLFASIIRDAFSELLGVGKNELFGIAYFIYISSLLFLINYLNGLETGLLILGFLLFIRFYQKSQILNFKNITVLGIILGLMVLIRIDTVYFVIVFSISLFFRKEITLKTRLIYVITICIVSFLISSPWWFYNYYYFNSLMPTSGQAQFEFGIFFSRLFYLSDAWVQNLTPFTYTFDRFLHGWISVIIRLIIIGAMSYYLKKYFKGIIKNTSKSNKLSERTYQIISVIFVYSLILTIWYFFFSFFNKTHILSITNFHL